MQHLLKYLNLSEATLVNCLDSTPNVEILNSIQDLMLEINGEFKNGIPLWEIPLWEKGKLCGCEHTEAKKQLLTALLLEYQKRMYKHDVHRMHLCEALLKPKKVRAKDLYHKEGLMIGEGSAEFTDKETTPDELLKSIKDLERKVLAAKNKGADLIIVTGSTALRSTRWEFSAYDTSK